MLIGLLICHPKMRHILLCVLLLFWDVDSARRHFLLFDRLQLDENTLPFLSRDMYMFPLTLEDSRSLLSLEGSIGFLQLQLNCRFLR